MQSVICLALYKRQTPIGQNLKIPKRQLCFSFLIKKGSPAVAHQRFPDVERKSLSRQQKFWMRQQ
jgi:hypothetical protein